MNRKANSYNLDNPGFIDSENGKRNGSAAEPRCPGGSLASSQAHLPPRLGRSDCVCAALWTVTLLLVCACIVIGLLVTGIIPLDREGAQSQICMTPTCVKIAGRILRSMDQKADPCEDFFQYACGGWVEDTYIPEGKHNWTPLSEIAVEISVFYKGELDIGIGSDDPEPFQKFKELYLACMNGTNRNAMGLEPVQPYVSMLGGMNYTGDWNASNFDLTEMLMNITKYQTFILFDVLVRPDGFNKAINSLILIPPVNRWGRSHKLQEEEIYDAFVQILQWHYQSDSFSLEQVKNVVNFTMDLLEMLGDAATKQSFSDAFSNKMTLKEMNEICNAIDWVRYFNGLMPFTVDENFEVYVYNTTFFEELNILINNTQTDVLNDFAVIGFILDLLPYLANDTKTLPRLLTPFIDSTHDKCLRMSSVLMRTAAEAIFMHKFFKGTKDIKKRVKEVVNYVRGAFMSNMKELDWIDAETKQKIEEKALMMGMAVSHAEILMNLTAVQEMTPQTVSRDNFLESLLNSSVQYSKILYSTVNAVWEDYYWRDISMITRPNAFYHLSENMFAIVAGLIDEPFYSLGGPRYVNYASLGTVVGHEIMHGFDTTGRKYDGVGRIANWWSNESLEAFDERKQCFIEQYGNMSVYLPRENISIKISGKITLNENIADAGGIRASFRAYTSWLAKHTFEPILPGMPEKFTWEKLFFLALVQPFCQETTKTYLKIMTVWDVHTPFIARVRGWVMNSDDFAEAYSCPKDSPMNPSKKCRIW